MLNIEEIITSGQVSATIIADSITKKGQRITTWELEYPRFIHGEIMTHRVFSRNAASSRAIPVKAVQDLVKVSPASPIHWGLNQSGMQAKEEHKSIPTCKYSWGKAAERAVLHSEELNKLGLHKQIVNRVLEPFQRMKTVITSTSYDNWFHLRNHTDAQPEIAALAALMLHKFNESSPQTLSEGMWHVPYVKTYICPEYGSVTYHLGDENLTELTEEEAIKISASCCAQVSYRKNDESLEKALKIWEMLVTMTPVHASPFEHQAKPMKEDTALDPVTWEEGVTHSDREGNKWSGNFKGWIQHRQLVKNHTCNNYEGVKA